MTNIPHIAPRQGRPTPHWEWRVFEPFPGSFINSIEPPAVAEDASIETYVLSAVSPHSVKIRNGMLDVKLLEQSSDDDMELWRPVFGQAFPIHVQDLAPVWNAWGLHAP